MQDGRGPFGFIAAAKSALKSVGASVALVLGWQVLRGSDFLGTALLAKFLEKLFLGEGISAAEQIEQEILRFFGSLAAIVLAVVRSQGPWSDEQLRHGSGTAGKRADEIAHPLALFLSA